MSLPPFNPEEHPSHLNHQEPKETPEGPRPLSRRDLLTFGGVTAGLLGGFWLTGFIPQWFQKTEADARAQEVASAQASASSHAANRAKYESSPAPTQQYYSGGSKAPEGEYRAADYEGPAQNVPKPKYPEGMDIETPEGLYKFIDYWSELRNYAVQTGDFENYTNRVVNIYSKEGEFIASTHDLYRAKGWVIGGKRQVFIDKNTLEAGQNHVYYIYGRIHAQKIVAVDVQEDTKYFNDFTELNQTPVRYVFVFQKDGMWRVMGVDKVNTGENNA